MRCPDCKKFVSVTQEDPEFEPEVATDATGGLSQQGTVSGDIRLVLSCADCGTELAESTQSVEENFALVHEEGCKTLEAEDMPELEAEATATSNDRFEGKGRGARHYYGADIEVKLSCSECGAEATVETKVEEQASAFESLG